MPFFKSTHYKCMETAGYYSNQTKELILIKSTKSVKAYMMNISKMSQLHRAYCFCADNFTIFSFSFFA